MNSLAALFSFVVLTLDVDAHTVHSFIHTVFFVVPSVLLTRAPFFFVFRCGGFCVVPVRDILTIIRNE